MTPASLLMLALVTPAGGSGTSFRAGDLDLTVLLDHERHFESDIGEDSNDRVEISRLRYGLDIETSLDDGEPFSFQFRYELDDYDFAGPGSFSALRPWSDAHTINMQATWSRSLEDGGSFLYGPIVQFSHETNTDDTEGFSGGGWIARTWPRRGDITWGAGVGVITRIEDDPRVFPVIILDWKIDESTTLTSDLGTPWSGRTGLEWVREIDRDWTLGLGAAYEFRRFQLDDQGTAPDGIGQEARVPVWARATWHARPGMDLTLWGGLSMGGELLLEDSAGARIIEEDVESAPFIGFSGTIRF